MSKEPPCRQERGSAPERLDLQRIGFRLAAPTRTEQGGNPHPVPWVFDRTGGGLGLLEPDTLHGGVEQIFAEHILELRPHIGENADLDLAVGLFLRELGELLGRLVVGSVNRVGVPHLELELRGRRRGADTHGEDQNAP